MRKVKVKSTDLCESPVEDPMPFAQATALKFRHGPIERLVTVVFAALATLESLGRCQNLVDMLGVVRPVGSDVQRAM